MQATETLRASGIKTVVLTVIAALTVAGPSSARTWITIDVPGGTNSSPEAINSLGSIVGYYLDPELGAAGFVRQSDGTFSTFAVKNSPTSPVAINDKGFVTGTIQKKEKGKQYLLCFLRDGTGRATICGPFSQADSKGYAINKSGVVVGVLSDHHDHGFLWDKHNGATIFDAPGATDTEVDAINNHAVTAGTWRSAQDGFSHAFIRDAAGIVTEFDAPGARSTQAWVINVSGVVAGQFADENNILHGFVRDATGNITVFDVPGGGITTFVTGINKRGVVVGTYDDSARARHGFERFPNGDIRTFDVPGSSGRLTQPRAIDDNGDIIGLFKDASGVQHGFLCMPGLP